MGRTKGFFKKKGTWFKRGHSNFKKKLKEENISTVRDCQSVRYVRLDETEQALVENNPILPNAVAEDRDSDNEGAKFKFLRARSCNASNNNFKLRKADRQRSEADSYRLMHCAKLWDMVNEVTREHVNRTPTCKGNLSFDFEKELQWGFCWKGSVICDKCQYTSKLYNLYQEVETGRPGRKAATANLGLNIAMTQTPVGPSSDRKLLLGRNIPAPSVSGLQYTSKKVSEIIEHENKEDMKQRRQHLSSINEMRGQPKNEIAVQGDALYNNSLWSGVTKTPYQPATQMAYIVAENVTGKHQIINIELVNKICSKHGFHSKEDDECDIKSGECTSTTKMETSIGDEKRWAKLVLEGILEDGLSVKYLPKNFKIKLQNEHNQEILTQCIEFRLGQSILKKTRLNTSTQKCEATNRSIRRSLPKNTLFSRNFPGRAHSAIHSVKNGPGESIMKLCFRAGCPIPSAAV